MLFGGTSASGIMNDTWEYDGITWSQIFPAITPEARASHEMVFDVDRTQIVMFGGKSGSFLDDTWFFEYRGSWPDETCRPGEDGDGDGLQYCEDVDCERMSYCAECGNGVCGAHEWCGSCAEDCGACTGCSAADIRLSEVFGGSPTYIEVVNNGSCVWDAGGVTILFRLDCDQATKSFTFPSGTVLLPGAVHRAVALLDGTMSNETSTGATMCDTPTGEGWVALCDGFCDLGSCSNFIDYFEKQGASPPVSPPSCAAFTPGPLSVIGVLPDQSATRDGFVGGGAAGVRADWVIKPVTRN